jgi:hypothetical protein
MKPKNQMKLDVTAWSRVLEKMTVAQQVKKCPTIYRT